VVTTPPETNLFGDCNDPAETAIKRLKTFEPAEGFYLAFSGGKDSTVLIALAKAAGVRFDAHFNLTSLDPPELVSFVRHYYPEVSIHRPRRSFFQLLPRYGFPMRQYRWCCKALKERGFGRGRLVLTGIRHEESPRRKQRHVIETCPTEAKRYLHPIIDWTSSQVWDYIHSNHLHYSPLYNNGFTRLGCIACPMAPTRIRRLELTRWPKFEKALRYAFAKLYALRLEENPQSISRWHDSNEMFEWWIAAQRGTKQHKDQTRITFD
jgi:phosphoadenosine phosphosulfate reductase